MSRWTVVVISHGNVTKHHFRYKLIAGLYSELRMLLSEHTIAALYPSARKGRRKGRKRP